MKCERCGRELTLGDFSFAGLSVRVELDDSSSDEQQQFMRQQMLPWEPGVTYYLCWACWMANMGFPVPRREK